ncbi:dihydrofolate reductase [Pedobacter sp. W3I1]|uniref:dihydrofolate reductase family protein n=1 Tax=Pedobacter sp. W3I1 TaxID=3042291 RepID=UPI0027807284|nr:dihydrofolate reductase family protein [Pedobacter sp. W3I1]MDQ0638902.1 dihydrofolate reductase [Pedobacter sp. W3I1]
MTNHEQTKSNNPTVVFTKRDAAEIVEMLEKKGHTEAVIIGGEMTISYFLNAELVDDIYFVVEPVLFGSGLLFFKIKTLI